MRSAYAGIILCLILLAHCASAIPTNQNAVNVNSSSMMFYATGISGTQAFCKYGTVSGNYAWLTRNSSNITGGALYLPEKGTPLVGNQTYYYTCCDETGCGAVEKNSRLANITPAPTTTFRVVSENISASHFDIATIGENILTPYTWVTYNPAITMGVLLFFVFTGLWMRQREVVIPVILGMIASGLLIYQGTNSVGIPPEMVIIVVGLVTVAVAGIVFGIFKR